MMSRLPIFARLAAAVPLCRPHVGSPFGDSLMIKLALFARLKAKPGKEAEVAAFVELGLALASQEANTPIWFALRLSPSTFGVFDAFTDEAGRQAHLNGPIAAALMANAPEMLAGPPGISQAAR